MRGNIVKKALQLFAFQKTPHFSLSCKLVPVQYRTFDDLFLTHQTTQPISNHSKTKAKTNKHLITGPKGNREFCFPETVNVPRGEVKGNIEVPHNVLSYLSTQK